MLQKAVFLSPEKGLPFSLHAMNEIRHQPKASVPDRQ
jgi:hypothetical protein